MTDQELVQELNRIFAEEVEAATRYLHLCAAVRGLERPVVEPILREGMRETIEHAEIIARKIRALGCVPELNIRVQCPANPLSGREALQQALTFEEAALEAYQDMLKRVEGNVPIEEFVRSQIGIESEHVAQLRELLDD